MARKERKAKKKVNGRSLIMEEGTLIITRVEFMKGIQELKEEGIVLDKTVLMASEPYKRWLYKIENFFKCSFDHPDKYLQEFDEIGPYPIFMSGMDVERMEHEELSSILLFLDSVLERLPIIPCKKEETGN